MPILQIKFATPFAPSGLQRRICAEAVRITAAVLR